MKDESDQPEFAARDPSYRSGRNPQTIVSNDRQRKTSSCTFILHPSSFILAFTLPACYLVRINLPFLVIRISYWLGPKRIRILLSP